MQRRCRIAVLMGGVSNEREVSFKSGKAVATALKEAGHNVFPVEVNERNIDMLGPLAPDAVFIALHGEFGEDGGIQHLLEEKGIPYTGSRPQASRMGMDKVASKRAFIKNAVPTADYIVVEKSTELGRAVAQAAGIGYPLVCKPSKGGSSLGVSIVRSEKELVGALEKAFSCPRGQAGDPPGHASGLSVADDCCLVESYAAGREFTVGIFDGEPLPLIEVLPQREFFDYEAKYTDQNTQYCIPVSLLESLYRKTQEVALRAYNSLGCRHMGRVDLIYGHDGKLYVLEINTIPGFTPRSLLPMAARYAGIEFGDLCSRIVELALRDAEQLATAAAIRKREIA